MFSGLTFPVQPLSGVITNSDLVATHEKHEPDCVDLTLSGSGHVVLTDILIFKLQ